MISPSWVAVEGWATSHWDVGGNGIVARCGNVPPKAMRRASPQGAEGLPCCAQCCDGLKRDVDAHRLQEEAGRALERA